VESDGTVHGAAVLAAVCLDIGGKRILHDITWSVAKGEKWVVLGLNGSGKTSLLRLLSGFGYPSRGSIQVLGESFGKADLRHLRKRIGWVHGDLAKEFPGFMTCREVVESGGEGSIALYEEIRGKVARRAEEALDAMGARHLSRRLFATLSTGERQRVLIARALAAGPELLLLDEPCIGLDPVAREDFLVSLASLFAARRELTVISVTHHVEEIFEGYGRVLLVAGGRVVARGDRREVLEGEAMARVYGDACRIARRDGTYTMHFVRTGARGTGVPLRRARRTAQTNTRSTAQG
jgi:iron complex transport system ATP-binding protein